MAQRAACDAVVPAPVPPDRCTIPAKRSLAKNDRKIEARGVQLEHLRQARVLKAMYPLLSNKIIREELGLVPGVAAAALPVRRPDHSGRCWRMSLSQLMPKVDGPASARAVQAGRATRPVSWRARWTQYGS